MTRLVELFSRCMVLVRFRISGSPIDPFADHERNPTLSDIGRRHPDGPMFVDFTQTTKDEPMGPRFFFAFMALIFLASHANGAKPNIVLIMADDLGYGDLGCYGHPRVKTPHIDQLAKDGVRFTQHYANGPECSPTRTAFLTGRYQQYAGGLECAIGTGNVGRYDDAVRLAKKHELGLPAEQTVLPAMVNAQGYRSAVFGKWHLGYEPRFNPIEHGWNEFFGYLGGNVHYFNHRETSD